MADSVLITGGAGFIGSHVADELLEAGYRVRVLDNLEERVHGGTRPDYLSPDVELVVGDVRDADTVEHALDDIDAVFHFAAVVGPGQRGYRVGDYVAVNDLGTATLLQALMDRPVERLIVASSMSIYGEGLYVDGRGTPVEDVERSPTQLERGDWELRDDHGAALRPVPTPETKRPGLRSVYAVSKYNQERMSLVVGRSHAVPAVALRFFNVFGPRQSASNPYTGVLGIFAAQLLAGERPAIFEDGRQRRDFVHVRDIARACRLALEAPKAPGRAINVGSGADHTVRDVAKKLAAALGRRLTPVVTGRYRPADVRHCFADIAQAREVLRYEPAVSLDDGLLQLAEWLADAGPARILDEDERRVPRVG